MTIRHKPVLTKEVVSFLARPDAVLIDGTIGEGGHAEALLEASGAGARLLGIDLDKEAAGRARKRLEQFGDRVRVVHGTFASVEHIASHEEFDSATGILFDLGMSSRHLELKRGFSFQTDGALDMRFDSAGSVQLPDPNHPALRRIARRNPSYRASDVLMALSEKELVDILSSLGGERHARRIARAIIADRRKIRTVKELAQCVVRAFPPAARRGRLHAATRTFQALRMSVNRELESLAMGITGAIQVLAPGGRLAVISFHEGEDRIVKHMFRDAAREGAISILTRKPMPPDSEEVAENPRSRSAKLRVAERIIS